MPAAASACGARAPDLGEARGLDCGVGGRTAGERARNGGLRVWGAGRATLAGSAGWWLAGMPLCLPCPPRFQARLACLKGGRACVRTYVAIAARASLHASRARAGGSPDRSWGAVHPCAHGKGSAHSLARGGETTAPVKPGAAGLWYWSRTSDEHLLLVGPKGASSSSRRWAAAYFCGDSLALATSRGASAANFHD